MDAVEKKRLARKAYREAHPLPEKTYGPCLHPGQPGSNHLYNKLKCRCEECTTDKARIRAESIERKKAGVVTRRYTPREHGEVRTYRAGCHCQPCTEANRVYGVKMREQAGMKPRGVTVPDKSGGGAEGVRTISSKVAPEKNILPPLSVLECGEELPGGGYCARHWPCIRHADADTGMAMTG